MIAIRVTRFLFLLLVLTFAAFTLMSCGKIGENSAPPFLSNRECVQLQKEMTLDGSLEYWRENIDSFSVIEFEGFQRTLTTECKTLIKEYHAAY